MSKRKYPRSEWRNLSELLPNDKNPRRITAARKEKLKESLDQLGNIQPVTFNVRTGRLLGGHKRVEILIESGETVTDAWCVDLPPEKESAAMLALNTLSGEWDEEKITAVLKELEGSEMDAEFFELSDLLDAEPVKIEKVEVLPPPKFAWVLVGVPINQFAKVQALLDKMPADAIMKTTAHDGPDEKEPNVQKTA